MDPIIQAMKLRLGFRSSPLQFANKHNPNVIKLAKMKRSTQSQYEKSPLININTKMNISPNSVAKINQKVRAMSRQSCNSQQNGNNNEEKVMADEHGSVQYTQETGKYSKMETQGQREVEQEKKEDKNGDGQKAYRTALMRNRISTHIDVQQQIRKNFNINRVKKCACGDCEECLRDFNYFLNIFSTDKSLPEISAKSWCIWKKGKIEKFTHYYGKRIHKVRQIASLTKMLTAMTAIDFLKTHNYDINKVTYRVKKCCTVIGGTTANLEVDEVYTLNELLYGMMLPSGNDAAIALSQAIGLMVNFKNRNKNFNPHKQLWYDMESQYNNRTFGHYFINLMAQKCQKMGLLDTKIYNSHGNDAFDTYRNISTCNQIAKISSQYIQKYQPLKQISSTKSFTIGRYNRTWENTNKLLDDGFEGIKTGVNESSGPCLAACYRDVIIVVLNSRSVGDRWVEVKKLVRWIMRKSSG